MPASAEYDSLSVIVVVPHVWIAHLMQTRTAAQYWERKQLENATHGRRLLSEPLSMGEWILGVRRISLQEEGLGSGFSLYM